MQNDRLVHYGIKGMKWGIRRYQNEDGTLTEAGKRRQEKQEENKQRKQERYAAQVAKRRSDTSGSRVYQKNMTISERNRYAKGRVKITGSKAKAGVTETAGLISTTAGRTLKAIMGTAISSVGTGALAATTASGMSAYTMGTLGLAAGGVAGAAIMGSALVVKTAATGYRYLQNLNAIRNA